MSDSIPMDDDFTDDPQPSDEPQLGEFQCKDCGKELTTTRGLRQHRTKVHGISEPKEDASPKSLRGNRKTNLEKELTELLAFIGMMVSIANPNDGQIIVANAERNAHAWANLARQNKSVDRVLQGLLKSSSWGEVMMATAATALPIMANHDMIPKGLAFIFGAMNPEDFAKDVG